MRDVTDALRHAGLLVAGSRATGALDTSTLISAEARGDIRRIRRGAYVGADHWESLDTVAQHVIAVRAALVSQPDAVISHWSAAAVLGLPIVGRRDNEVHLTVSASSGGRSTPGVRRHQAAEAFETTMVDGIRITPVARTVVDLARDAGVLPAVVAGDAASRMGAVTAAALAPEIAGLDRRRGVRAARRAIALVNPLCESPGESLSRVRMAELGLPTPQLQRELRDAYGFVARVDFMWPDLGVVGEFDGRSKYGLDDVRAAADRLWQEKLREDRIRALGPTVVRWTWDDAWLGEPMARKLRAAGVR